MLNKGDFQRDLYLAQGKRHSDGAYRGNLCIPWCVFFLTTYRSHDRPRPEVILHGES